MSCCDSYPRAILLARAAGGFRRGSPLDACLPAWKAEAERPMRLATYTVAPGARMRRVLLRIRPGRKRGSESGPLDRPVSPGGWKAVESSGQDREANHPRLASDHGGCLGRLHRNGRPNGAGRAPAMPGYRMLGAIVEGPQGSIFFKFTGPAKTVAANQAAFDKMLASHWQPSEIIKPKQYVSGHPGTDRYRFPR